MAADIIAMTGARVLAGRVIDLVFKEYPVALTGRVTMILPSYVSNVHVLRQCYIMYDS